MIGYDIRVTCLRTTLPSVGLSCVGSHKCGVTQLVGVSSFTWEYCSVPPCFDCCTRPPCIQQQLCMFSLNTSALLTHDQSTPLNNMMESNTWLYCINETIPNALPILDSDDNPITFALVMISCSRGTGIFAMALRPYVLANCLSWIRHRKLVALDWKCSIDDFQNYL